MIYTSSIFKQTNKLNFNKICFCHLELLEESGVEPVVEGVTFYVKYLGSSVVVRDEFYFFFIVFVYYTMYDMIV